MKFIKITNLQDQFEQVNYKGLNIDEFIPGSQVYMPDLTHCIVATKEDEIPNHNDIIELSNDEYISERQSIMERINNLHKTKTPEEFNTEIETLKYENEQLKGTLVDLAAIVLGV